jgi:hypothetical protein
MLALKTLDCLTVAIFQISPLLLYVGVPFGSLHLTNSAQYDSYGRTRQSLHVKSSGADVVSVGLLGQSPSLITSFQISLSACVNNFIALGPHEGGALGEVSSI